MARAFSSRTSGLELETLGFVERRSAPVRTDCCFARGATAVSVVGSAFAFQRVWCRSGASILRRLVAPQRGRPAPRDLASAASEGTRRTALRRQRPDRGPDPLRSASTARSQPLPPKTRSPPRRLPVGDLWAGVPSPRKGHAPAPVRSPSLPAWWVPAIGMNRARRTWPAPSACFPTSLWARIGAMATEYVPGDSQPISFGLRAAKGEAAVAGNPARYPAALPGLTWFA